MDQSVGFSVLVVDNDERSLANLVKILIGWKYKVLTANSAHNALETLREFEGFFDLIITEFHIPGIDGFEFQKCIKDEFQLPIILISKENRKDIISKSLENGVAHHILKPFCSEDFKDIWKYTTTACNEKSINGNDLRSGELEGERKSENVVIQDESKSNRKCCKRKTLDHEDNNEGRFHVSKKPKVYWNTHLHNLFLHALKQIGFEKAVPKRILEVMNIPHLTRENVASHLQKYRLFMKKVVEKGMVEGLSHRALKSKFAESLPISMIHDIRARYEKQNDPFQQKDSYYFNPFNKLVTSYIDLKASTNNSYGRRNQFPYYSKLYNQVLQNKSALGRSNIGINNIANTSMLSSGNHNFSYVQGNSNMGSFSNSGFINGTLNENINVTSLGNQNLGLLQKGVGSEIVSKVGVESESGLIPEMGQQKLDENVGNESEVTLMEEDPSKLFLMLDDMGVFNNLMEENNFTASDFSNVDFSDSFNIMQPLFQFDEAENVTVPEANITSNLTNVSPINSEQNSTQLEEQGIFAKEGAYDKFTEDIIGSSNTSASDHELELDMEKLEALFGTDDDLRE